MKITLDIKVHPEFGPNVDVQPDEEFWTLSNEQQQALVLESIRALEHQIIMLSHPQEDVADA